MSAAAALTPMGVLRSTYDPRSETVMLELRAGGAVPSGSRLALTSIVQLTPPKGSEVVLERQLATYHEFSWRTDTTLAPGDVWTVDDLALSHLPRHANDGPVSAFLIFPDATTRAVDVVPMRRAGTDDDSAPGADAATTDAAPALAPLVPYPAQVTVLDAGRSEVTRVTLAPSGPVVVQDAWRAVVELARRAGYEHLGGPGATPITAVVEPDVTAGGYRLSIDGPDVTVTAGDASGFRHAFVTLAHWLAAGVPRRAQVDDQPRYAFRGLHVDLARQWFEPSFVERLIDLAAWRKLSHLHLHLTDDEGWRLPVDDIPELASIAAVRGHGRPLPPMLGGGPEPVGRVYTPSEIAAWVDRADALGVVLVPEIDMPGHMHAALTALPHLRDPDDRSAARSVQYFVDNVLVPGHPPTATLLGGVLDAVAALFPDSPYIHIGGDEVAEDAWRRSPVVERFRRERALSTRRDVEAAFVRDVVEMVRTRTGRQVGAWQEAAESGGVRPGDGYVVGWRTPAASRELAAKGYDVVVSPGSAYYLDMAIDGRWASRGGSWAGSTSLAEVCAFDPEDGWTTDERARLLGVQACLWSEHVHSEQIFDELAFPRLDAIAERAWSGEVVGGSASISARSRTLPAARPR